MRLFVVLAVVMSSSLASANVAGFSVAADPTPVDVPDRGGTFGLWAAGSVGERMYVGGEFAGDFFTGGASYHALAGVKSQLSPRVALLADAGAGLTQQLEFHLGLFGGESGFDTTGWTPSAALRMHLVGDVLETDSSRLGIGLTTEARTAFTREDSGYAVGLGIYVAR